MAVPVPPLLALLPDALFEKLQNDPTDINRKWEGGWYVGRGRQSTIAIWLSFNDRTARLSDRMIVKTISTPKSQWYDPAFWSDGLNATGVKNLGGFVIDHQMPIEGVIHQRLTERTQGPLVPPGHAGAPREHSICQYRGRGRTDVRNRRWKLFMEWCPLSSLTKLITKYREAHAVFPEPFIWYVAEELLLAIQLMQQGTNGAAAVAHWRPLVHRDIKPDNVFLSYRSQDHFRHYPKIKLGDFGLVCETSRGDTQNNPIHYSDDTGTPGFLAPEQRRWYQRTGNIDYSPKRRLDEKTNVWGVGMTLYCLAYLTHTGEMLDYQDLTEPGWATAGPFGHTYSQNLIDFAISLTKFNPNTRPTVAQALHTIRNPPAGPPLIATIDGMDVAEPSVHITRDQNPHRLEHANWHQEDGKWGLGVLRGNQKST